jgi:hypothetical protein
LAELYKFSLKINLIQAILVVGLYYFDFGLFGFDFGNIGTLTFCNRLIMKNAYGNNAAKERLPYCGNRSHMVRSYG